jgi:hypothetical protein
MGVSITEGSGGSLDMDLVLKAGQGFLDRLAQLKAAKDAHDAAYERLGIGKNAAEQMDLAARMVNEAKLEADKVSALALEKAAKSQKDLNEFVANAKDATMQQLQDAQAKNAEADRKLAAANENHAASLAKLAEADDRLAKAKAAHEAVLAAQAALNKAVS